MAGAGAGAKVMDKGGAGAENKGFGAGLFWGGSGSRNVLSRVGSDSW